MFSVLAVNKVGKEKGAFHLALYILLALQFTRNAFFHSFFMLLCTFNTFHIHAIVDKNTSSHLTRKA